VLRRSAGALHCPGGRTARPVTGSGFYRLQFPQSATAPAVRDIRPALAGNPTPTLVLKGSCDYLSWRSALDYTTTLPQARLVYVPDAGHNLYQDQPSRARASIRAFLLDQSPPIQPYQDRIAPPGYRGPH
jgi:pimeloyl-ACP methyl ester carboxylesterase